MTAVIVSISLAGPNKGLFFEEESEIFSASEERPLFHLISYCLVREGLPLVINEKSFLNIPSLCLSGLRFLSSPQATVVSPQQKHDG